MNNLRRVLTVAGLGAGLAVSAAFGGTITQSFTANNGTPIPTDVNDSQSVETFNYFGAYGLVGQTLNSVTIAFTGDENVNTPSLQNTGGTLQSYTFSVTGNLTVDSFAGGGAGAIDATDLTATNSANLSSFNIWALGTTGCKESIAAGTTQNWFTNNSTGSAVAAGTNGGGACTPTIANPTGLTTESNSITAITADFTQTGTFNLSYITSTVFGGVNNGNLQGGPNANQIYDSLGSYTVTYNYSPSGAPEPTTMFLLGSGLVGLGFLRRRATKR